MIFAIVISVLIVLILIVMISCAVISDDKSYRSIEAERSKAELNIMQNKVEK